MPEHKTDTSKFSPAQREKMHKVLKEFAEGTLRSSSGEKVTSRAQAVAIAISEAKRHGR